MSKRDLDRSYFVTFCIEQFKQHRGICGEAAAELLYTNNVPDYLNANYDVLHTQSRQWLMEEIDERLNQQTV